MQIHFIGCKKVHVILTVHKSNVGPISQILTLGCDQIIFWVNLILKMKKKKFEGHWPIRKY
jgi:hypothetical protein